MNTIAIVDPTGSSEKPGEQIFQRLKENYIWPSQKDYFVTRNFPSSQAMTDYHQSTASLEEGVICFALDIQKWDMKTKDYSVILRYQRVNFVSMHSLQTRHDSGIFDWGGY